MHGSWLIQTLPPFGPKRRSGGREAAHANVILSGDRYSEQRTHRQTAITLASTRHSQIVLYSTPLQKSLVYHQEGAVD